MGAYVRILAAAVLALAFAGPSSAALKVGVAEDAPKGHDDGGGTMFWQLRGAGLSVVRMTVMWDEARPTTIVERAALDRAIPEAAARGVEVMLHISPLHAGGVASVPNGADLFAAFVVQVLEAYPQVQVVIVGNEPNQPRFWRPQFDASGAHVAAATYEQLLAKSYDAVKAWNPAIDVVGLALSPRGNDKSDAATNASTAPVTFIHDLGIAYRASARAIPLMDDVAFHPYPNPQSADDPPAQGMQWPNAGVPNLDRLEQAFWDAFHGTGQAVFAEGNGTGGGVHWIFDESGWQTDTAHLAGYTGAENENTVSEDTQAQFYAQVIGRYSCDARVSMLLFFHWIDEADRDRMQTGLLRADGSFKPAASVVASAIRSGCTGAATSWTHTTGVVGSAVSWKVIPAGVFTLRAEEDFAWTASVVRVGGPTKARATVRSVSGMGNAYWKVPVKFAGRLPRGRYAYTVTLRAAQAMDRTTTFTGKPFTRR